MEGKIKRPVLCQESTLMDKMVMDLVYSGE